MTDAERVELRAISPSATPEEVAAIVAAVTQVDRERRAAAAAVAASRSPAGGGDSQRLSHWRASSRLSQSRYRDDFAITRLRQGGRWRR